MSTQLGQTMTDLSKGSVPIMLVFGMLSTMLAAGYWFGNRSTSTEITNTQLTAQVTRLEAQVLALSGQLQAVSVALAKGPVLPDNVAFKADLFKFCLENRQLKCPQL